MFNSDDQKELTGWFFMVVNHRWGVSKVCVFREEMGNGGLNWILQSHVRAVLKMGINRVLPINDWHFLKVSGNFSFSKRVLLHTFDWFWANYCQCLTMKLPVHVSSIIILSKENFLCFTDKKEFKCESFLLWQFLQPYITSSLLCSNKPVFLFGNPKELDHLEVLGIDGTIILF